MQMECNLELKKYARKSLAASFTVIMYGSIIPAQIIFDGKNE
jgi:hypothetical protein